MLLNSEVLVLQNSESPTPKKGTPAIDDDDDEDGETTPTWGKNVGRPNGGRKGNAILKKKAEAENTREKSMSF